MDETVNPYEPPEAAVHELPSENEGSLAPRVARLAAVLIDTIIGLAIILPIQAAMGVFDQLLTLGQFSIMEQIVWNLAGWGIYLLLHGYPLATRGQSLGKMLLRIKIVRSDGGRASFGRILGLRLIPLWVVAFVPVAAMVASLADALFIFRQDRRCIHDLIADTVVVEV